MNVYAIHQNYKMGRRFITMEITILSAQGLKKKTNLFSCRKVRPFITLTTKINGDKHQQVYKSQADNHGGTHPTWGEKFQLRINEVTFFNYNNVNSSCIFIEIHTKCLITGQTPLGWCHIPLTDIVNEFFPEDGIRWLSFQLRNKDGSRGYGVVDIKVELAGLFRARLQRPDWPLKCRKEVPETVIGIPVTLSPTTKCTIKQ